MRPRRRTPGARPPPPRRRVPRRAPGSVEVFHPSLPDHPDAAVIAAHYLRHGSIVSFRVGGADEARTRHIADVLASTTIVRYALSFDGLATKVNHHQTVSEYFTPAPTCSAAASIG